jgi:hypothetical protein
MGKRAISLFFMNDTTTSAGMMVRPGSGNRMNGAELIGQMFVSVRADRERRSTMSKRNHDCLLRAMIMVMWLLAGCVAPTKDVHDNPCDLAATPAIQLQSYTFAPVWQAPLVGDTHLMSLAYAVDPLNQIAYLFFDLTTGKSIKVMPLRLDQNWTPESIPVISEFSNNDGGWLIGADNIRLFKAVFAPSLAAIVMISSQGSDIVLSRLNWNPTNQQWLASEILRRSWDIFNDIPYAFALSPDGTLAALLMKSSLEIIDIGQAKVVASLGQAITPGNNVAAGGLDLLMFPGDTASEYWLATTTQAEGDESLISLFQLTAARQLQRLTPVTIPADSSALSGPSIRPMDSHHYLYMPQPQADRVIVLDASADFAPVKIFDEIPQPRDILLGADFAYVLTAAGDSLPAIHRGFWSLVPATELPLPHPNFQIAGLVLFPESNLFQLFGQGSSSPEPTSGNFTAYLQNWQIKHSCGE